MKRYVEGHWWFDPARGAMLYLRSGEYDIEESPEPSFGVETHLLPGLFNAALDAGVLPVMPGRGNRDEDLKVIHRLLDILEKRG